MQNAGQQFGQGGAPSHQSAPFGHSESTTSGGSITSSLRQFRRKNEDKQPLNVNTTTTPVAESHVARVPPHNHYPARQTSECYRYPQQYQDYNSPPVKFSEVTDPNQSLRENISSSVIQKTKDKEYMEMCNVQQPHMKQPFDHLNSQQSYPESNIHPHVPQHPQYVPKDAQVLPAYKPESQYFPKDSHYQQIPPQMQKYNMPSQIRKYPPGNDFLSKLRRIHPTMARSIMSDHHLQESQAPYQPMDQTRMYSPQTQRYMNYPPMPNNTYPPGYMSSQSYPNYPTSCSYTRSPQMGPRFPSINSHERSISPRRSYSENMTMPMNYGVMSHQKASPNFPPYTAPEYAQHYQHRRAPIGQEYYQQQCRPNQYLPHQMTPQDMSENRVTVSDSIKQYIENWADEETATELENSRHCKDGMRIRDDQSTETVYMINASELQYFENGIPLVTSENTIPMVASENGQYIIKSGVSIENTSGMVRLVDNKNDHIMDLQGSNEDRVVNLHIMDSPKQDCMLANKPNELNQRQTNEHLFGMTEKPRVVVHQNTVIQSGYQNIPRDNTYENVSDEQVRVGNSLPIITDTFEEVLNKSIKECRKVTVDKNCSPINLDQLEEYKEVSLQSSVICSNKNLEEEFVKEIENIQESEGTESSMKSMPFFDTFPENIGSKVEDENHIDSKCRLNKSEVKKTEDIIQSEEIVSIEKTSINTETLEGVSQVEKQKSASEKAGANEEVVHPDVTTPTMDNITNCQEKLKPVIPKDCSAACVPEKEIVFDKVVEAMEVESIEISADVQELTEKNYDEVDTPNNEKHKEIEINELKEDKDLLLQTISTKKIDSIGEKPTYKRSRRIFSVDDIMNNIGNNLKPKSEKDILVRRHSLQCTKEFLDKEIANIFTVSELGIKLSVHGVAMEIVQEKSSKENPEVEEAKESISITGIIAKSLVKEAYKQDQGVILEKAEEKVVTEGITEEIYDINGPVIPEESPYKPGEEMNPVKFEKTPETPELVMEEKIYFAKDEKENNITNKPEELFTNKIVETNKCEEILIGDENIILDSNEEYKGTEREDSRHVETFVDASVNKLVENSLETVETASQTCYKHDRDVSIEDSFSQTVDFVQDTSVHLIEQKKVDSGCDQNEIQYRSVIRVEESSVLLQIAGELVEVNVNSVNGKNIITVVPLSDTAILDLNDNYEGVINTEANDPLHIDNMVTESNDAFSEAVEYQAVDPEPEIVETTSEIIIGMDLSLEEEIKLDIAQPPKLCTKAAKKAYESDLQIPSITTSEDVYDKIISEVYSGNDKVSSSKEHTNKNFTTEQLVDSSRKLQKPKRLLDKINKKKGRNQKESKQQKTSEEEEFVPFKELIRARKLKKLKQQENKNNEDVTVDSTMKIDDVSGDNVGLAEMEAISKSEAEGKNSIKNETISKISKKFKEDKLESKKNKSVPELKDKNKKTRVIVAENKETSSSTQNTSNGDEGKSKRASSATEETKVEKTVKEIRKCNPDDPRLRGRSNGCSSKYPEGKRKLSLEEYNKRKRNMQASDQTMTDFKTEKISFETKNCKSESSQNIISARIKSINNPEKINFQRPKSLDDLNSLKPKENKCGKRKLSLQCSPIKQNYFDWEETQSPKTNSQHNNLDKRFSEFRGLINIDTNDKSKLADHSNPKSNVEISGDEILQNYKEQVDFKLSSLKFEIPRCGKPTEKTPNNPFSKSESSSLMQRFLKDEKLSSEEMEKICKIISYKRLIQQLKKDKVPESTTSKINQSYEIHKESGERDTKLHLKKVSDKKRKNRFRNLYTQSNTESDDEVNDNRKSDYSVVQSNCLAGVVPKLIIKRKTEMPLPVVRLERLDLGLLANKRIKYVV